MKPTVIKIVPTITCNPCNPVDAKNTVPNTESAIVNPASEYSIYCKTVNTTAKIIVIRVPKIAPFLSPAIKAW
jgi:hypothetical protein